MLSIKQPSPVAIAGNDTIIQTNQTACTPVPYNNHFER